ncbi:unnamed protein product [Schistocephalus solidus]|uniref:Reverse transcriptase domain-containing protein n=1 Tax=Schistocephalus solidus TaxID=70667 RepID=A0A183TGJ0_SCHSO|nr:unnamed protein product [Schistocephalus solidus]
MHPRSLRWQLMDYVLVRRRDRQNVLVTKEIRDAGGWTDHRLFISNIGLQLQPPRMAPSNQITQKLKNLHAPDNKATVESRWCQLRNVIQSTAIEVLKRARCQRQKFGCPERFTHMVRQLQDGMTTCVTDNGTVYESFAVTNGVKKGCVLAPKLLSPVFSAMLMDAYCDEQRGIRIAYRSHGHLLISRRMQAPTRVSTTKVNDLLFADDYAINTVMEEDM